ncbi:MAG: hypothetical protein ACYDDO_03530 [Acidiferrobacterales bacterium]
MNSVDARKPVPLPPMMQHHMLADMRDHLFTIKEIERDLADGHFDAAGQIAEHHLGVNSLQSHDASHMAPYMRKAMQTIGDKMHRRASRFAVIAPEGDFSKVLSALADVTSQCVATHEAYRLR